jgi:hypothetical protein
MNVKLFHITGKMLAMPVNVHSGRLFDVVDYKDHVVILHCTVFDSLTGFIVRLGRVK